MRNKIQVAFDLGSHSIKSAVGRIQPDGKIEVLSIAEIPSKSIDCGDIVDKDLLLSHLEILIEKMEKDAKINIDEDAWVSVSGRGVRSINSSTRIRSRENTDFEIDEEIKQKLLNQCSDVQVSSDRYVLHNIEQGYYIGSSPLIRNPIGMVGKSIDAKAHVIHVRNFNLSQLDYCFNEDLSIEPFPVFDGYAASSSNLTHDEKELGVIFVDIGSDKTNILIFKDNFNFSKMCNLGSEHSTGDYLLFLNDDTWIIQENWLEELVKICSQNEVGAVGPKLLYPNYTIQHAGMVLLSSLSGFHPFQNIHDNNPGYHNLANVTRECSAVTGACLLVKKDVFDAIGGWDVKLDVYYGDTDLCLKIQEKGFKIIYTPNSKLIHNASSSIKKSSDIFISVENHTVFSKRWKNLTNGDPYYNPNLNWNYQIKIN